MTGKVYPGASMMASFTWQSEYHLLSTYAQYAGMTHNGAYILHYQTVRNTTKVRRLLPPPSSGTINDIWPTNYLVAEILEKMPEEMYIRINGLYNGQLHLLEARFCPLFTDAGSEL